MKRIENLWNFCKIKTNLPFQKEVGSKVTYRFIKSGITLIHSFNPKFLQDSTLEIQERGFNDRIVGQTYGKVKKQFGMKNSPVKMPQQVFFPEEILKLKDKYSLIIQQDKNRHYKVTLSPFVPKNIYEIFDTVNLISLYLWKTIYFSEITKN
ncbi:hypothetical protein KIH41_14380 [Litoribacter ruber]|uniref:hypothetical protein n=1 Tax=Litoribacter ruber TaxID=702568 RepID=UPI001BDAE694|nr:hypothetical protein [Litoribacter ruber]MBT0812471.1 hypothetical protein [Litoribacter ruber]